jgi:hypothetical protein
MPSSAKLIITAPANTSMAFASAWIKTQSVFKKYVRCNGRYDTYEMFLSSGLPYHLPFSFELSSLKLTPSGTDRPILLPLKRTL